MPQHKNPSIYWVSQYLNNKNVTRPCCGLRVGAGEAWPRVKTLSSWFLSLICRAVFLECEIYMRHSYRMVQDRLQQSTNILTCRHHMLLALKAKMAKVTYLISQDNSTLTFPTFYLSSNHCNVLLKYEEHICFLYLNVIYFCRSSHGSMWIQWSSHRLLKIVKSISSKAENCAWFGDCL